MLHAISLVLFHINFNTCKDLLKQECPHIRPGQGSSDCLRVNPLPVRNISKWALGSLCCSHVRLVHKPKTSWKQASSIPGCTSQRHSQVDALSSHRETAEVASGALKIRIPHLYYPPLHSHFGLPPLPPGALPCIPSAPRAPPCLLGLSYFPLWPHLPIDLYCEYCPKRAGREGEFTHQLLLPPPLPVPLPQSGHCCSLGWQGEAGPQPRQSQAGRIPSGATYTAPGSR